MKYESILGTVFALVAVTALAGRVEAQTCGVPAYYAQPIPQAAAASYSLPAAPTYAQSYGAPGVYPVMRQPIAGTHFAPTAYQAGQMGFAAYQSPYQAYHPVTAGLPVQPSYFGTGAFGTPKTYVSGQPVRNFLRFLTP